MNYDWIPLLEHEIAVTEAKLVTLKEELKTAKATNQQMLEDQCISQHGNHLDDGGMFFGRCVRCGKHLG